MPEKRILNDLKEILRLGASQAARVLADLSGMTVELKITEIYKGVFGNRLEKPYFLMRQRVKGDPFNANFYFTMLGKEFLKFLAVLESPEVFNDYQEYDLVDSFLEVGNIISGNIISVFASFMNTIVEFELPTMVTVEQDPELVKKEFFFTKVYFEIKEIEVHGYVLLAFDEKTYAAMVKRLEEIING
ncbi:hypothetical protein [Kosmotoga pacifica]|uniref:Chemotaxis protein CheC n=1 Tax=Kosmotoga pacifica TaxID=1330330 RepID=A0A0G2ZAX9_9BACT|nr:hypothetical protein [Kosmotoga pacifica]AKI97251.1 hypothetical protein IX53_04840 [Kosmotoga pacifica]